MGEVRPGRLDVSGGDGEPLPHTWWRHADESRHLGLILPGAGYSTDMPLLYYARALLIERGADVMAVGRNYAETPSYLNAPTDRARVEIVADDARSALARMLRDGQHDRITIVAKSVSTLAVASLLAERTDLPPVSVIWLTPTFRHPEFLPALRAWGGPSLFVTGTADPRYVEDLAEQARLATSGRLMVVAGANHSLEIGNTAGSLSVLAEVMAAIQLFLDR